jgi:hypothetical protein
MFEARHPWGWLFLLSLTASVMWSQTLPTTTIREGLFSNRSGTEKKDAAMSFLEAALSMTDAVTSRKIVDEVKFKEGQGKVIDGTVECLNASIWAKAQ